MRKFAYVTSEELARNPVADKRTEIVRGRLVIREPASPRHGEVAARVLIAIGMYLDTNPIGRVYAAETGFTLARSPDTVRAPDVAYFRADRAPTVDVAGFPDIAPDLVVEVLSPGERAQQVRAKVADWLRAGTTLVWLLDTARRSAHVYRADGTDVALTVADALDGELILPGFRPPIARLLSD